ncbi:uncharacterized protein LOC101711603 isoform X2 [Heterocephalus glaber]|uniref:Uncharacterized protein LOC101711603 isoform X2 n=1 Tax=Heterocephalus glaber TaxID=10181 RepID=A0AAX6RJX9_HETGA|nr:uncharacterized protein LOC101711603 isoform X2 [Heterocephalus glaber]
MKRKVSPLPMQPAEKHGCDSGKKENRSQFLGCTSTATEVTMAVPLSPSPGAEVNVVEFKEYKCSWVGENELQFEDCRSSSVRPEAAVGSLDTKVQKCGGVKYKDDVESLLGEKPQPKEQELSAELPLTEQLRVSTLLIREQKWELSELTKKLKEGRAVSLLLKESLEVHLSRGHPDNEHSWRQGLAAGCRLAEQLVHMLNLEIPEQEEDGKEQLLLGPSVSAEGLQREEEEDHLTPSGGSEPGETQQPPCTTAALVDEVETPSPGASAVLCMKGVSSLPGCRQP